MSDPRFARLRTDPRFRTQKKYSKKVVVDERFNAIFNTKGKKKAAKGGSVDKYGRHVSDTHEKDNLSRFYRLEGDEEKENGLNEDHPAIDFARGQVLLHSSDEEEVNESIKDDRESDEDEDAGEVILGRHASKPIPVLAEEEDELLEVDLNEDEDTFADLDAQAAAYSAEHAKDDANAAHQEAGVKTNRLAVVNLDWDHVRATHLYKIFSSLVSPIAPPASISASILIDAASRNDKRSSAAKVVRGKILGVRIYPSEFGKERMKKEEVEGPPKEIFKRTRWDDEGAILGGSLIQEDEGHDFDEKALRKYQLEKLRYYYAIVTCDTVEAAAHLVSELDGAELERSANVFDLSYVPDDMTFDDEFRDEATEAAEAALTNYKGLDFSTEALRHSKVKLKWDEDDPERSKVTRRALSRKEIEEGDYRAYIASSSESEDERAEDVKNNGKAERERLRKLLFGGAGRDSVPEGWGANPFSDEDKGAEGDMEITFMPGLSEANAKDGGETTIEKYKRKQKEKRLARQKEKEKENVGKKTKTIDDDFFAAGSSSESDEDDTAARKRSRSKAKASREEDDDEPAETRPATEAKLELLVAPDDVTELRNHFDMKSIIKAEKERGKRKGKKGKKKGTDRGEDEVQEDFQIDVKDERFKALHEDHTFAIDPSNPHFKKTKSMAALLEERSKRQSGNDTRTEAEDRKERSEATQSLQSLVESVKRKSMHVEGKGVGKRRKL